MELVSAAKTRRAVEEVLRTRTYANLSWQTVLNLAKASQEHEAILHPLLIRRKQVKREAVILISSNRGLCGGFNTSIINKVYQSISKHQIDTDFIIIGKKGSAVYKYFGYKIVAEFPKADIIDQVSEVTPIARMVIDDFLNQKYDRIMVAYTDFINATRQLPRVKQLLPVDITTQDEFLGVVGEDTRLHIDKHFIEDKEKKYLHDEKYSYDYIFEPSPEEVLNEMLPRLIEIQLYQALLESNAAEHSARMSAMHQATDAAEDMVDELTLFFNKARQASITREIAEISAGANALKE